MHMKNINWNIKWDNNLKHAFRKWQTTSSFFMETFPPNNFFEQCVDKPTMSNRNFWMQSVKESTINQIAVILNYQIIVGIFSLSSSSFFFSTNVTLWISVNYFPIKLQKLRNKDNVFILKALNERIILLSFVCSRL